MATVRGCNLPEDLYCYLDKYVWAKPVEGGLLRVGMTSVAGKLAGGKLSAVTVESKSIGQEVKQGKSLATVESSKFTGPVPAPVSGVLVRGNDRVAADPNLPIADPHGQGWLAEIQPTAWYKEADRVVGVTRYGALRAKLEKLTA